MDEGSGMSLSPRLGLSREPRCVRTANGGLHAVSLLTKERVQRFVRHQCDRGQADFVEHAKAFGRTLGEFLTASQRQQCQDADVALLSGSRPASAQRFSTPGGPTFDGLSRLLEAQLLDALKAAEIVAHQARRMGDTGLLSDVRSQMVVLSYSAASLRGDMGNACAGLYERALMALDRIEQLAGLRDPAGSTRAARPPQASH
ncbi:MAG: hypothetical protein ABIW82_17270 [Dokdonella sp.]